MAKVKLVAASALVLMVASACSSGSGSGPSSTAAGSASAAAPDGAVTSYQDAQKAVIQIVAGGEYVDIASGESVQSSGSGSGFIIDPSGIAVTNAHVVEGAGSVAKNNASGDTSWAGLDYSLQDTAQIQPATLGSRPACGVNDLRAEAPSRC